ncbi:hypothetical protein K458DRAFT_400407 [Lentithecium fluviatile CBS 122367]|uniref:Apple domain-containing protein n=1 Tax=Lentithecium fluviatile CBS 122367 TaxID=1168545 RepID=A0A6G1JGP1_9PLEO|nr:hypothetical protein K458DRAFT_400407 [Lentithecium fluviatile CBS 122367]
MREFIVLAALAGFSGLVASQSIDLDYVKALPDPTYTIASDKASQTIPYNQDAAMESAADLASATPLPVSAKFRRSTAQGRSFSKRNGDCQPVPTTPNLYNAVVDPAESFQADNELAQVALSASTPSGYTQTFSNKKAASQANGYMGYTLLSSYDTTTCANKCNQALGCQGFNIYFERSPSIVPAPSCPNPPGTPNIFCVLWGGPVTEETARNDGQWRDQFHVVIAGSNGYVLTSSMNPLSSKAINAPRDCNDDDAYMGMRMFTDNAPFDPERCKAVCEATSQYNIEHNSDPSKPPRLCKFFDTYILSKNYISQGQACFMYTQYWDPEVYATNDGQWDGEGNHYTISSSVFFHNGTDVVTPVCPSDITRLQGDNSASAFCAAYIDYEPPTTSTVTSYTSTTTVEACGGAPTNRVKRDEQDAAIVEAVVAVYPQKIGANATGAAQITIPAESMTVSEVYASATSEAASQLGVDAPATMTSANAAVTARAVPTETPSFFVGRDSREISSACSHIATGTATRTVEAVATATNVGSCAQYPTVCENGDQPQLIAGSFTSSTDNIDDTFFTLNLPFEICIYDSCSTRAHMTTNGMLHLGTDGNPWFVNAPLPAYAGQPYLYAFWDDLYIYYQQKHYMDYAVCGSAGHRTITFDWRMGRYAAPSNGPLYSFSATFYEDKPSRVYLRYFGTTDQGSSATVGMEGTSGGQSTKYQYSFNEAKITDGLGLIFDPHANYFGVAAS